jgi:hypothetical protein
MTFKEELAGFSTVGLMGLLGMALYSGTYSLIYTGIMNTPAVAILEMWMSSVHLFCAAGCCVLQGLYAGLFKSPTPTTLPHLAEAQTALFLGVACAVTVLGNNCMQYDECSAYYGAASFPRLAAAGSIAWAWVMYASSLGCQGWERGLSLGFNREEGMTAASVMIMLPCTVNGKLKRICGWTVGGSDEIWPIMLMFCGLVVYYMGKVFTAMHMMVVVRITGNVIFMGALLLMPTALWSAYNFVALGFALNTLLGELWHVAKHDGTNKNNKGRTIISFSGITHRLRSTFGHRAKHSSKA